jgi:hypothetical protein
MKLPYFKKRYYLSGIDWIIAAIDYYMKKTSATGNHSTLLIETFTPLLERQLKERLEIIFSALPILNACQGRDIFNLAPYWKVSKKHIIPPLIKTCKCDTPEDINKIKDEILNMGFRSYRDHLFFTIITGKQQNALLMTFDHKLLDARGAEIFLNLLTEDSTTTLEIIRNIKTTDSPKLKDWNKKFDAGRDIQRHLIKLSQNKYIALSDHSMKRPPVKEEANLTSTTAIFSKNETEKIINLAEKKAGYMMETPFLLAVTAFAIHSIVSPEKDANYSVPMPIDMRKSGMEFQKMLFNHLSFMFLAIKIKKKAKLEDIICEIRNSIFYNIENELPEKLIKATRLTRISPLPILKHFMKLPLEGKVASFAFANVGESPTPLTNILSNKIKNISHMPRIPTPPGLGIFFNRHSGKTQFTLTWDKNAIEKDIASAIIDKIKKLLIED